MNQPDAAFMSNEAFHAWERGVPFTLACVDCEDDCFDFNEALNGGWLGIEFDLDGFWWFFIGTCPACAAEEAGQPVLF